MRNYLAALLCLFLLPLPCRAADDAAKDDAAKTVIAQRFAAVLQNPGHRKLVLQAARATPAWAHKACAGAYFKVSPEVAVYVPVRFNKKGEPVSGEWRERVVAKGCGAPMTLNVLTRITGTARLATGYLLPGDSIADPILENAAEGVAVKAAGGVPKGCASPFIADTKFLGYDNGTAGSGAWKERWTLDFCGVQKLVVMHFAAGATRVTIHAEPADAGRNG